MTKQKNKKTEGKEARQIAVRCSYAANEILMKSIQKDTLYLALN